MPLKLRRKRYAAIVVSLLTLVFVGVGAVVSMMTLTTFRPLPFVEPNQLVQYVEIEDGDPELWESDSLAQTTRLIPEIIGSAMYTSTMPMPLSFGALEKPARLIVTSPNFLSVLGLRVDRPSAATAYATTPGTAIISRSFARSLGLTPESAPGQQIRVDGRSLTVLGMVAILISPRSRWNATAASASVSCAQSRVAARRWKTNPASSSSRCPRSRTSCAARNATSNFSSDDVASSTNSSINSNAASPLGAFATAVNCSTAAPTDGESGSSFIDNFVSLRFWRTALSLIAAIAMIHHHSLTEQATIGQPFQPLLDDPMGPVQLY